MLVPELGRKLLQWAAASNLHIVLKVLSPHRADGLQRKLPSSFLQAGADPAAIFYQEEYQPLHMTVMNKGLEMVKLPLDHDTPINTHFLIEGDTSCRETFLNHAYLMGHLEMVNLLNWGADIESVGHYGEFIFRLAKRACAHANGLVRAWAWIWV
jgi:hypothetical protein